MLSAWDVLLVVLLSATTDQMAVEESSVSCPTWFSFNNRTQQCECGQLKPWGIRCNQQEMKFEVANGYCVSYLNGLYYAGDCDYMHSGGNFTDRMFSVMPSEPNGLNDVMCGSYNRKGLLCAECIDGYGPAVYSFGGRCADCSKFSVGSAVILYLLSEFLPILLFFVFVMIFHINITAGPLLGYVSFCQFYLLKVQFKSAFVVSSILLKVALPIRLLIYSSLALCGVWSLKFSWVFVPPFCISSHLTGIQVQLLELVPSAITVVILVITSIFIEFHKRNCSPIVKVWKVIGRCLKMLRLKPVDGNAVIHAFSTFIFLSAYNLNYVGTLTLNHDPVSHSDGSFYKELVASDPTITWFSHRHLTYLSSMAVVYFFLVVIPSLLLCVYPTRIYRYLSRMISTRRQLAIKTFAEALHSCFKDGLNGTRDYRALAGLCLFSSLISMISFYIWEFVITAYSYDIFCGISLIVFSILFAFWRPCKSLISNISISYHIMALGFLNLTLNLWKQAMSFDTETLEVIFIIIPIISHIFVLTWVVHSVIRKVAASTCLAVVS